MECGVSRFARFCSWRLEVPWEVDNFPCTCHDSQDLLGFQVLITVMIGLDRGQQGKDTLRKGHCRLVATIMIDFPYLHPGLQCLLSAQMIDVKLHLIVNSTPVEVVICVLEDTRRSIVSRNHGEPGISVGV